MTGSGALDAKAAQAPEQRGHRRGAPDDAPAPRVRTAGPSLGQLRDLVVHLARREVSSTHRDTLLGWAWPLTRQLVQLAVLVFVFSKVLDLGIPDYPVFVFSGLIAWNWFTTGLSGGTRSLLSHRYLVFQPRLPAVVVPIVAVAVPLIDVAIALPVLVVMLVVNDDLHATILLLPALLAVQFVLLAGLAWMTGAVSVYLRDVPNVVGVVLLLLFYVTPVYFSLGKVPPEYASILQLNPLATLIEAYRSILLDEPFPGTVRFAATVAGSIAVAIAGLLVFRRLEPGFVDEL
jgi:lipopolysaccharide transport system permease protein